MSYHIGQILPPASQAPEPFGPSCEPAWYCVHPKPNITAHSDGREFFRGFNMFAFYPSEERFRVGKGDRKRTAYEAPMVTGYLFAQCLREPMWHIIKQEAWCAGVFKIGESVIKFPYAVIRHLQGLTVDAERLARANADLARQIMEASRPVEGQQACFVTGPFSGQTVTVETVQGQLAYFELMGKRIAADTTSLRRI